MLIEYYYITRRAFRGEIISEYLMFEAVAQFVTEN